MTDYDLLIVGFFHQFWNQQIDIIFSVLINFIYVVLLYFLYYFWQKKQKRSLYLLIASGIIGLGIATGLKYFFNRPRPFASVSANDFLSRADSSFPSRHSFLAGLALYFLPKHLSKRLKSLFVIYLLILIPFSLLLRAEHFISDIVIGLGIGYLVPFLLNRLLRNKTFVK